jgi:hypothetical protein
MLDNALAIACSSDTTCRLQVHQVINAWSSDGASCAFKLGHVPDHHLKNKLTRVRKEASCRVHHIRFSEHGPGLFRALAFVVLFKHARVQRLFGFRRDGDHEISTINTRNDDGTTGCHEATQLGMFRHGGAGKCGAMLSTTHVLRTSRRHSCL